VRFLALRPGSFPATAMPPEGLMQGPGLIALRRALADGDFGAAEGLWAALLQTVLPLGPLGRNQVADCFEAYACLKDALGKPKEAERFRRRALSVRKDPMVLNRRAALGSRKIWGGRPAWESDGPSPEVLQRVNAQLDREEVLGRRRKVALILGTSGIVGLGLASFTGLPTLSMLLLGLCVGWLWVRWA
jgi:hypothetical protein